MIEIDPRYKPILLESLEELMYKLSLQLEELKGQPMTTERRKLTEKQILIEDLQHQISMVSD